MVSSSLPSTSASITAKGGGQEKRGVLVVSSSLPSTSASITAKSRGLGGGQETRGVISP